MLAREQKEGAGTLRIHTGRQQQQQRLGRPRPYLWNGNLGAGVAPGISSLLQSEVGALNCIRQQINRISDLG